MYTIAIRNYFRRTGYICVHPRAALIDMDGTLYDSMPHHAAAWREMMAEIGVDVPTDDFFRYEGRTGASTIDLLMRRNFVRAATEQECSDLYRRKTELFAAMPPVEQMPGAARMLNIMHSIGMKRVLVTGSGQNTLLNRLEEDYPGMFPPEMRITSRDVTHGKPNPEPFLKAMEKAGMQPWECIVVENAPLGVEAGHAAGIFTVGVNTGPLDPRELSDAGADVVFNSMEEFADSLPMLVYGLLTTMNNVN